MAMENDEGRKTAKPLREVVSCKRQITAEISILLKEIHNRKPEIRTVSAGTMLIWNSQTLVAVSADCFSSGATAEYRVRSRHEMHDADREKFRCGRNAKPRNPKPFESGRAETLSHKNAKPGTLKRKAPTTLSSKHRKNLKLRTFTNDPKGQISKPGRPQTPSACFPMPRP